MNADYISYLEGEFSYRKDVNPSYSMRAFARDLEISVSTLSELFSRKHNLSLKLAMKVVNKLNLSDLEKKNFLDLVTINHAQKDLDKEKIYQRIKRRTKDLHDRLPLDLFKAVSDWQHFAMLELIQTKSFKADISWVAKRLSITEDLVKESLDRMVKLGAIKVEGKAWEVNPSYTDNFIGMDIPSEAIKKFHRQVLKKIIEKIDTPIETREYSSTLLALNEDEYQKIKKKIKKFKSEAFSNISPDKKDKLYVLGVQLVPLENEEKS